MIIFCDIDGILADCSHRLHFLKDKDYDSFYDPKNMLNDSLIPEGAELIEMLAGSPYVDFYYLTGRPTRTFETTQEWLKKYGLPIAPMLMRKNHDYRKSEIVKAEEIKWFFEHNPGADTGTIFIDDDPKNVIGVCNENSEIKGIVFGAERLHRVCEMADRYEDLKK